MKTINYCGIVFLLLTVACHSETMFIRSSISDSSVEKIVLEKFPIGTNIEYVVEKFPDFFVVFDANFNGSATLEKNRGEKSEEFTYIKLFDEYGEDLYFKVKRHKEMDSYLRITINKDWPKGLFPYVKYRYVDFVFSHQGKVIDLAVSEGVDTL